MSLFKIIVLLLSIANPCLSIPLAYPWYDGSWGWPPGYTTSTSSTEASAVPITVLVVISTAISTVDTPTTDTKTLRTSSGNTVFSYFSSIEGTSETASTTSSPILSSTLDNSLSSVEATSVTASTSSPMLSSSLDNSKLANLKAGSEVTLQFTFSTTLNSGLAFETTVVTTLDQSDISYLASSESITIQESSTQAATYTPIVSGLSDTSSSSQYSSKAFDSSSYNSVSSILPATYTSYSSTETSTSTASSTSILTVSCSTCQVFSVSAESSADSLSQSKYMSTSISSLWSDLPTIEVSSSSKSSTTVIEGTPVLPDPQLSIKGTDSDKVTVKFPIGTTVETLYTSYTLSLANTESQVTEAPSFSLISKSSSSDVSSIILTSYNSNYLTVSHHISISTATNRASSQPPSITLASSGLSSVSTASDVDSAERTIVIGSSSGSLGITTVDKTRSDGDNGRGAYTSSQLSSSVPSSNSSSSTTRSIVTRQALSVYQGSGSKVCYTFLLGLVSWILPLL